MNFFHGSGCPNAPVADPTMPRYPFEKLPLMFGYTDRTSAVVSRGEDQAMSHNVVELSKLTILICSPDTTGVDGAGTRTKECLMTQVYPVRFTVPAEQFNRVLCACFRASSFDTC